MTNPSTKLAESLEVLKGLQNRGGIAICSRDMTRTHREWLVKCGFVQLVMKGWYLPSRVRQLTGVESTNLRIHETS